MTTTTLYRITASYTRDGQALDATQAEVLGDAHGRLYADLDEATAVAAEMTEEVSEYDLDPSTTYDVQAVDVEISDVEAYRDDEGGLVTVLADVTIDHSPVPLSVTVYGKDCHTTAGIHGLEPSGGELAAWAAPELLAMGDVVGRALSLAVLASARLVPSDAGLVVAESEASL